ncbi:MAG: hypothetical protein B7733_12560 [Myxococcales bacterium FL481]|nr:MAG: hypothetical protein B7733_12560 [Myxococcales bacterium FL481]
MNRIHGVTSWLFVAWAMACGDRAIVHSEFESPTGSFDSEPVYAECEHVSDCTGSFDICVFSPEGAGFCSFSCDEVVECAPAPGGSARVVCVSVGPELPRDVCALECSGGRACPDAMVCKPVATNDGERALCF